MTTRRRRSTLDAVVLGAVFPAAAPRSRNALGVSLAGLTALLLGLSLLKWQAPLVGLVALGLPLLFVLHLWNAGMLHGGDTFTAALGVVFGIGWAIGNDAAVASVGPDALGTPVSTARLLATSLVLPLTFLALLITVVAAARYGAARDRRPSRGCLIGALGGYSLAAASTLTELASQFDDGLLADDNRTATALATAAIVQGLAIPLTAAGIGGAIGAALWPPPPQSAARGLARIGASIVPIAVGAVAYPSLGVLDLTTWSNGVVLAIHSAVVVLALATPQLVLRARAGGAPPALEVANRGSNRESFSRTVGFAGIGAALVMVSATALSLGVTPPEPKYVCPPNCGRPPLRQPVATNPRFTSAGGEFSVSYPGAGTAYTAEFDSTGVVLTLLSDEGGTLRLYGQHAAGRTAQQVVHDVIADSQPHARVDYEIPNALVGYRLGYGVVADVYPTDSIRDDARLRMLVMAAVKDDYALIAAGAGPFREFGPNFGSGHPSGANFLLALDMGKYVNSFTWRGDPPR